jgi:PBP1b-binding outer membrane lipoprotein LpoB
MKKGLLSILASALLVVGCQNYDDQFSNLESQISALATTVAGLSQVQSDLSSLAGTVNSLSSTVSGLGDTIDTAVADGLADIQADIDAIETAVADVASSEEVSDLSDAVAASQEDLDELLANSSVFNGDVTINSEATLAAFKSIGSGLAIVNGNVNITVSTSMSQADVQTVVDEILTVTKDFTYTAGCLYNS